MNEHAVSTKNEIITDNPIASKQEINDCSFPYYRSSCCYHDSVLIKDIGVSCELLKVSKFQKNLEKSLIIKHYDTKWVRSDHSAEYSSITRRISSYTKEMLNNITMKIGKKNYFYHTKLNIEKIPIAMEYCDENGQPGLKLRIHNTNTNDEHCESKKISMDSSERAPEKHSNAKLQTILSPVQKNCENPLSTPSTSSINSYSTTGNRIKPSVRITHR